jgi:hypothetical protein
VIAAATSTHAPIEFESISPAPNAPDVVVESYKEAHASPEAASSVAAVGDKKTVEAEMLEEIRSSKAHAEKSPPVGATSTNAAALSDEALVGSGPLK